MFQAKTLQDSLLPLIYMSIPFGIAPRLPILGKSLQCLSLAFSLTTVAFGAASTGLLIIVSTNLFNSEQLRWFIRDVPTQLTSWSCVMAFMASVGTHLRHRRSNTFADIIEMMGAVDDDLKLTSALSYSKTKKVLWAIGIVIPMIQFILVASTSYRQKWEVVFYALPNIVTQLLVVQYVVLATLLKQRFALINRNITKAFSFSDTVDEEDLSTSDMASASKIDGMITTTGHQLEILDMLQDKHSNLTEIIQNVNSLYAVSNITILMKVIVSSTRNLYNIIYIIVGGHTSFVQEFFSLLVLGVCINFIKIFVYAVFCEDASSAASRPVVLMETLKLRLGQNHQTVVERLDLFAKHTQYRFTAYSLVNFDCVLVGDTVSTVVMYLIILLQFAVTDKSMRTLIRPTSLIQQNSTTS